MAVDDDDDEMICDKCKNKFICDTMYHDPNENFCADCAPDCAVCNVKLIGHYADQDVMYYCMKCDRLWCDECRPEIEELCPDCFDEDPNEKAKHNNKQMKKQNTITNNSKTNP